MNHVQIVNVVQIEKVQRRRSARRDSILTAARRAVDQDGLDGLTMKGLADELDLAVGTLYTYFPSKAALVAAMQVDAIHRLAAVYEAVESRLEPAIAALPDEVRPFARLALFGRSVAAAERHQPDEVHLQQRLLNAPAQLAEPELGAVTAAAFAVLARPQGLLEDAAARRLLTPADPFERMLRWISGLNGILLLRGVPHLEGVVFDLRRLADDLTLDLLRGWGADPDLLAAASAAVPYDVVDVAFASEVTS